MAAGLADQAAISGGRSRHDSLAGSGIRLPAASGRQRAPPVRDSRKRLRDNGLLTEDSPPPTHQERGEPAGRPIARGEHLARWPCSPPVFPLAPRPRRVRETNEITGDESHVVQSDPCAVDSRRAGFRMRRRPPSSSNALPMLETGASRVCAGPPHPPLLSDSCPNRVRLPEHSAAPSRSQDPAAWRAPV